MKRLSFLFTCMAVGNLMATNVLSDTIKMTSEEIPVQANISQQEPTRIKVMGDRIAQVIHKSGVFSLQENPSAGEIFITPTPDIKKQPINVFVITEQGGTYTLVLTPKDMPATSVILNPGNTSHKASLWEQQTPWQQTVVSLIKALGQGRLLPGYQREVKETVMALWDGVAFTQTEIYRGQHLQGEVYRLKNEQNEFITVDETRFYRPGVAAVSLDKTILQPGEEIKVTVVLKAVSENST